MSSKQRAASPPLPSNGAREGHEPPPRDARLVMATLAAAASLAAGVLVALAGSLDGASLLLVTGGLVLAACLHRLGRAGPESD